MSATRKPLIRRPGKYASRCGQIIEILSVRKEGGRTVCTGYACTPTSGGHYRRTIGTWNERAAREANAVVAGMGIERPGLVEAPLTGYVAAFLDGIWLRAPYLHNGSVPTLYQLLSPQSERDETFYRGTFEYDPRHLGYRTEAFDGGFVLDTRISGNHNSGHEFRAGPQGNGVIGRLLQPEERWALLEYLKVLGSPLEQQVPAL